MERQAALEKKEEYAERKVARIKNDQEELKKMKESASNKSDESAETDDSESVGIQRQDSNEYFKVSSKVEPSKVVKILSKVDKPSTRSGKEGDSSQENHSFPQKPVRNSLKDIDSDIVETMVTMESTFNVKQRKVAPLLASIMNKLAGQSWELPIEDADNVEKEVGDDISKRKRKDVRDLTFVLPSRSTT